MMCKFTNSYMDLTFQFSYIQSVSRCVCSRYTYLCMRWVHPSNLPEHNMCVFQPPPPPHVFHPPLPPYPWGEHFLHLFTKVLVSYRGGFVLHKQNDLADFSNIQYSATCEQKTYPYMYSIDICHCPEAPRQPEGYTFVNSM
jgi:hypothetical protein